MRQHRWDPPDINTLRMLASMSFEQRLLSMLRAQQVLLDTIRGQLSVVHPEMDIQELNLLVFKEIQRRQARTDRLRTRLARKEQRTSER